jgi:hypothetical protein
MSRRTDKAAERAAAEASEAARTLAVRGAEVRRSQAEPAAEEASEPAKSEVHVTEPGRVEKLLKGRPHTQAMDALLDKRELAEAAAEPEKETPAETTKVEAKQEAPVEQPAAEAPPEAPKTVRVKVDGEEFDAPKEEVDAAGGIHAYQRDKASENRLKKMNEALAETRRAQAEIAEWVKKQQKAEPEKPQQSDKEFIAAKMDIVRFGSPDEAAAAWLEIQQRNQPKQLDQNAIIEQATNRMRHDQAVQAFDNEFADVVKNPLLLRLVVSLRNERMGQLPKDQPVDWGNFYRKIGNEVRSVLPPRQSQPQVAAQTTASNPSQPSEKEARKASITNLPTASARAELPKEEKELSPEEERKAWIAEQKKARGQG